MRTAAGALLKKVHAAQGHGSAPSPRPESGRAPLTFPGTYRWSCRDRARKRFSSYIGPRFAARATPIVARNYAFLAACFEAYEMCILFASLHSQQLRTCSSRCVLIFWRTFGAGGPRRWYPRRSSPSSRSACGRASRAREERKMTRHSSRVSSLKCQTEMPHLDKMSTHNI